VPKEIAAMDDIDVEKSFVDWTIDCPASLFVFKKHSIDYCCAGKSLQYSCAQAGANLFAVVAELRRICVAAPGPSPD
jgi:regulator of cell morphogenesis and NO signaling